MTMKFVVALFVVLAAACSESQSPTRPAPTPTSASPAPTDPNPSPTPIPPAPPVPSPSPTPIPPGPSTAVVAVEAFAVSGTIRGDWFNYRPTVRLTETSGKSGAWVTSLSFHLDDIGPAGNVPVWNVRKRIEAGATRDMIGIGSYGDPDFEIESRTSAARVSVVIRFTDDEGRPGSVSAAANVSR